MGEFSFPELIVIVILAIVLYGKNLPQAARKMANLYTKFRRHLADIKDEISRQIPEESLRVDMPEVDTYSSYTDPPPAPMGLAAAVEPHRITLTWNPTDRATTYSIRRAGSSSEPRLTIASGLESTTYVDADLPENTAYTYVVTASNSAGESGESLEVTVTTPAAAAPAGIDGSSEAPVEASGAAEPAASPAAEAGGNGDASVAAGPADEPTPP
jgi:Sec-independent protein translocase protein TatA